MTSSSCLRRLPLLARNFATTICSDIVQAIPAAMNNFAKSKCGWLLLFQTHRYMCTSKKDTSHREADLAFFTAVHCLSLVVLSDRPKTANFRAVIFASLTGIASLFK